MADSEGRSFEQLLTENLRLQEEISKLERVNAEITAEAIDLRESDRKRLGWIENSPVCTKVVDLDNNLRYMSGSGVRDLKIDDITEYYGKPYPLEFYPDSFKIPMTENLERVKKTGEVMTQEAPIKDVKGNELWFHSTLIPINDAKGKLDYILIVSLETTERKRAEDELRLSEHRLQEAQSVAQIGSFDANITNEDLTWSEELFALFGLSSTEFLPTKEGFMQLVHPSERDAYEADLLSSLEAGVDFRKTFRGKHTNGEWRNFETVSQITYDQDGQVYGLRGTVQDITERVKTQRQLRLNQERLLLANKAINMGSYDMHPMEGKLHWDTRMHEIFELDENSEVNRLEYFGSVVHPDDQEAIQTGFVESIDPKNKETHFKTVSRILLKNDVVKFIEYHSLHIRDENGQVTRIIGTCLDVSERTLGEIAIQESQAFNESLLRMSTDIIYVYDIIKKRNVSVNDGIEKILGYSVKEIQAFDNDLIAKLMHPDDFKVYVSDTVPRYKVAEDGEMIEHEYRMKNKNGDWHWLWSKESIFKRDDQGNPTQIFGLISDITERKKAEYQLKVNADRFDTWKSSNFIGILQSNSKGVITEANDMLLSMLGYSKNDLVEGNLDWNKLTPPEYDALDSKAIKEAKKNGYWTPFEKDYYHKDGHRIPILIGGSLLKEVQNEYIAFVVNLTERKKVEKNLRNSQEFLSLTGHIAKVGGWELDLETNKVNWSAETKRIHEVPQDYIPQLDTAINFYHPDDRAMISSGVENAIVSGDNWDIEARIITAKGNQKHVRAQGQAVFVDGKCVRLFGAFQDISDRKLIEAELAKYRKQLEVENVLLKKEISLAFNYEDMVYASEEISDVLTQVEQVSSTDATVLVLGETGTGKELIAKAVHNTSDRKDNSLIRVNCATIPAELLESELFGHMMGSFTGATADRIGKFELADKGTLFLDEIGELPLALQPKLLRAIQEGEIEPIGSSEIRKLDVRIIAATNKDLKAEVRDKLFREDLYFRLNVFPINIPPLRDRIEDIAVLVDHFVIKYCKKHGKDLKYISDITLQQMKSYPWPGNVRELENMIERAVIISTQEHLLFQEFDSSEDGKAAKKNQRATLKEVQRNHIIKALNETNWKIDGDQGAAILLDIKPSTLRDRIKKFGISRAKK